MNTWKYIAISALLALTACGSHEQQPLNSFNPSTQISGIIGGVNVDSSDVINQSTVALVMSVKGGEAICTGVLVTENIVLTAAHCLVDVDGAVVVFGTDIKSSVEAKRFAQVSHGVIHPDYDPHADKDSHDLALVRFEGLKPSTYEVAKLLSSSQKLAKNLPVTLAGYGASFERRGKMSGSAILRKTTVPLTNPYFSKTEISFSSIAGKGACHGDSGGPAYATINGDITVVGVTSRTTDELGGCHKDSVYTKVSAYEDFIKKSITQLQSEQARQD